MVPLALKDQFKQDLDNMVSQGILSKLDDANVNTPEWLNSFVVVKKPNGKLRICLDPTVQTAFSPFLCFGCLQVFLFLHVRSVRWFWGMVVRGFARRDLC